MLRLILALAFVLAAGAARADSAWHEGDSCPAGDVVSASKNASSGVVCWRPDTGTTSTVMRASRDLSCSWNGGVGLVSLTVRDVRSGVGFWTVPGGTACEPGVTACSSFEVYSGRVFDLVASTTCSDCEVVCEEQKR